MPDITMCCNKTCPMRIMCYRAQAKPDRYQSFAFFRHVFLGEEEFLGEDNKTQVFVVGNKKVTCSHFVSNED